MTAADPWPARSTRSSRGSGTIASRALSTELAASSKAYETQASPSSKEVERKAYDAVKRVMSEYCLRGQPHPHSGGQPCPPAGNRAANRNIETCSRMNNDPLCTGWHQQDGKHDKYRSSPVTFASRSGKPIAMDDDWWRVLGLGRGFLTVDENRADEPQAGKASILDRGMRTYCRHVDDYEEGLCRRVARGDMWTGNEPDPECACLRRYDTDTYRAWRSRKAFAFGVPDAKYNRPATTAEQDAARQAIVHEGTAAEGEVGIVYGAGGRCPLKVGRYIEDRDFPFKPKDDICHYPACSPQSSNLVPFGDRPAPKECSSNSVICQASILSAKAVKQTFRDVNCSINTESAGSAAGDGVGSAAGDGGTAGRGRERRERRG